MNTWMNNVTFLAIMAHIGWAALIVTTAGMRFGNVGAWASAAVCLVAAAVKEYWYDAKYELPRQTSQENTIDFAAYVGGIVFGLINVLVDR